MARAPSTLPISAVGFAALGGIGLQWDDYTAKARHLSERWATSDRGWCHLTRHPDARGPNDLWANERKACGNYLDYAGTSSHGPNGETIHAMAYLYRLDPITRSVHNLSGGFRWFATVPEAKAWIEATVRELLAKPIV